MKFRVRNPFVVFSIDCYGIIMIIALKAIINLKMTVVFIGNVIGKKVL